MQLSVIGTGYLGATPAAAMAELGHEVVGVDSDPDKITRQAKGEVPFFEPGPPELLRKQIEGGRLRFTTSVAEARPQAEVHFVCVGTPQKAGEFAADVSYVDAASAQVAAHVRAFMARAGELGADQPVTFLKNVDEINLRRRARTVDLTREMCDGSLAGRRVGVLGAAFEPNSDDIRDSPALDVAAAIQRSGAAVRVYDPAAMDNARVSHPTLAYTATALEACRDADVVLHLTEWLEFRELTPSDLAQVVGSRKIVDGRGALDADARRGAGWQFRALGRP